jgi:hypothetical protein
MTTLRQKGFCGEPIRVDFRGRRAEGLYFRLPAPRFGEGTAEKGRKI